MEHHKDPLYKSLGEYEVEGVISNTSEKLEKRIENKDSNLDIVTPVIKVPTMLAGAYGGYELGRLGFDKLNDITQTYNIHWSEGEISLLTGLGLFGVFVCTYFGATIGDKLTDFQKYSFLKK